MSEPQPQQTQLPEAIVEQYTGVTKTDRRNSAKAHKILELVHRRRHTDDVFLTEVNTGPTSTYGAHHRRMDAIALKKSWAKPMVTGYEVKVSRQDFLRDDKWPIYLSYCNVLYFACPPDLIQPDELPPEVGLLWVDPEKQHISVRRKAVYRNIEIPSEILYYVIIARTDSDRYPFFSSRVEFFRALVEDRADKHQIGHNVGKKLREYIRDLERKVINYEHLKGINEKVFAVMKKYGLETYDYTIADELDAALSSKGGGGASKRRMKRVEIHVDQIQHHLKRLMEELGNGQDPDA